MFALVRVASGEIQAFMQVSDYMAGMQTAGDPNLVILDVNETVLQGRYEPALWMFDLEAGDFVSRPLLFQPTYTIAADGVDKVAVTVPVGTAVEYGGEETVATDGEAEFEFTSAYLGTFAFQFRPPFPYQPQTVEITVQ